MMCDTPSLLPYGTELQPVMDGLLLCNSHQQITTLDFSLTSPPFQTLLQVRLGPP